MRIGLSFNKANLFDKTVDTSDEITEGAAKLFYPSGDAVKVADLPSNPNAYLEIPKLDVEPAVGEDGEMYQNTTDGKFFLVKNSAWVEVLFSMEEITP